MWSTGRTGASRTALACVGSIRDQAAQVTVGILGTSEAAQDWVDAMRHVARGGVDPVAATITLSEYGDAVMSLAVRGLEARTLDRISLAGASGWSPRWGTCRCG